MRTLILLLVLVVYSPVSWSASAVPETKVNHAWVKGVYWNNEELDRWGFFVDVQEENFFGAVYGYLGNDSTFITLQGGIASSDPLVFSGDVYFLTNGGGSISKVGDFTWEVVHYEASPGARLTISSNIINADNLSLERFNYSELGKVDMITGGDWNIIERVLGESFGEHYAITNEIIVEDGIEYAIVVDNAEPDKTGLVAWFPPEDYEFSSEVDDMWTMLVQFDEDTDSFYAFYTSDTDMFGRYWLLGDGESPTGNGHYFQGSADTMQKDGDNAKSGGTTSKSSDSINSDPLLDSIQHAHFLEKTKAAKKLTYSNAEQLHEPMFEEAKVLSAFEKMSDMCQAKLSQNQ